MALVLAIQNMVNGCLKMKNLVHCKSLKTPLPVSAVISTKNDDDRALSALDHKIYSTLVSGHYYLATCTRPDILLSVSVFA